MPDYPPTAEALLSVIIASAAAKNAEKQEKCSLVGLDVY
jgi:hypothetical protein